MITAFIGAICFVIGFALAVAIKKLGILTF